MINPIRRNCRSDIAADNTAGTVAVGQKKDSSALRKAAEKCQSLLCIENGKAAGCENIGIADRQKAKPIILSLHNNRKVNL